MSALAESARKYLGVKFRHRGRSAHALDCAGLVRVSYADLGVELEDYTLYSPEPARHGPKLTDYMIRALGQPIATEPVPYSSMQDGDVVVIRYEREPHHVAIVGTHPLGYLSLVHAHGLHGRVLEQGMPPKVKLESNGAITHLFRRTV